MNVPGYVWLLVAVILVLIILSLLGVGINIH